MATIALEGMSFFARHGVYEDEKIIGNKYTVDIYINIDTKKAGKSDNIGQTINYETIYEICRLEMKKPSKLLENISARIVKSLKHQFKNIKKIKVKITKLNPPLGGKVERAFVESEHSFSKKCPICNNSLICYNDDSCWCKEFTLHSTTIEHLKSQYKDNCLCRRCLNHYADLK